MTFKVGETVRFVCTSSFLSDYPEDKKRLGMLGVVESLDKGLRVLMQDGYEMRGWGSDSYEESYEAVVAEATFSLLAAMTGKPLKFRSGCDVKFVAYVADAKPHCQLILLNPATGNVVTRYANGKSSEEPYSEPGDIILKEQA
jgi:hypothetical protein